MHTLEKYKQDQQEAISRLVCSLSSPIYQSDTIIESSFLHYCFTINPGTGIRNRQDALNMVFIELVQIMCQWSRWYAQSAIG